MKMVGPASARMRGSKTGEKPARGNDFLLAGGDGRAEMATAWATAAQAPMIVESTRVAAAFTKVHWELAHPSVMLRIPVGAKPEPESSGDGHGLAQTGGGLGSGAFDSATLARWLAVGDCANSRLGASKSPAKRVSWDKEGIA